MERGAAPFAVEGRTKLVNWKVSPVDHAMMHGVPDMMHNIPPNPEEIRELGSGMWINQKIFEGAKAFADQSARLNADAQRQLGNVQRNVQQLSQSPVFQSDWLNLRQNQGMQFNFDFGMH